MSTVALLSLALAALIFAATPGPAVASIVATAAVRGVRACIGLLLGIVIGDLIVVFLALAGLGAVAQTMGPWFLVLKVVGAAYLIWLGIGLWRKQPQTLDETPTAAGLGNGIVAGLLLMLSNPKAILFYVAFFPTFVDVAALSLLDMAVVAVVVVGVVALSDLCMALLAGRAGRFVRSHKAMRRLNRASGTVMIGAGVVVATR